MGEDSRGSARRGPACQAEAQRVRVLASERARRGEGREGRERAQGWRGRRLRARALWGWRLLGLTLGRGGTRATSARGEGAPRMAGPGRAGRARAAAGVTRRQV